jgi:hypothetical protein
MNTLWAHLIRPTSFFRGRTNLNSVACFLPWTWKLDSTNPFLKSPRLNNHRKFLRHNFLNSYNVFLSLFSFNKQKKKKEKKKNINNVFSTFSYHLMRAIRLLKFDTSYLPTPFSFSYLELRQKVKTKKAASLLMDMNLWDYLRRDFF